VVKGNYNKFAKINICKLLFFLYRFVPVINN
jgi:hypothetical protein